MSKEFKMLLNREAEPCYPYDAIVLLCGGTHRKRIKDDFKGIKLNWGRYNWPFSIRAEIGGQRTGEWMGNFETQLKVAATAEAFDKKLALFIISSGGPMWNASPLGEIMRNGLTNKHKIPSDNIIEENEAIDTGTQMKNILDIIQKNGFKKVAVVADSVHLPVAKQLLINWAEYEDVPLGVEGLAMENLLIQRNPRYKRIIDKMHKSLYWKWWKLKYEKLAKALEKDPLLRSPSARASAAVIEVMRTKFPFTHLRLPGTT